MSEAPTKRTYSIAGRLTLATGAIIACSTSISYLYAYDVLSSRMTENADRYLRVELREFAGDFAEGGLEALREEIAFEEKTQGATRVFARVKDSKGNELISTDLSSWGAAADWDEPWPPDAMVRFRTVRDRENDTSTRRAEGLVGPDTLAMLGIKTARQDLFLSRVRRQYILLFCLVLGLGMVGAWVTARRAMQGVQVLTRAAEDIAGGALNRRIAELGFGREVDGLATVFNRMVGKVEALIAEARTMNDNIAHELRSPLTRIRGSAEVAATSNSTSTDCRDLASGVVEECDNMLGIVNSMLAISQMESGLAKVESEKVDCVRLLRDTCDFFQPLAEDRSIELRVDVSGECAVQGDSARLHLVVANLIDNALKYTEAGGSVTASLDCHNESAVITVRDTGMGIDDADLPHIFKRFYRSASVRGVPGNGLGLGLVLAIVSAHGGWVDVSSVSGQGTTVKVYMPKVS